MTQERFVLHSSYEELYPAPGTRICSHSAPDCRQLLPRHVCVHSVKLPFLKAFGFPPIFQKERKKVFKIVLNTNLGAPCRWALHSLPNSTRCHSPLAFSLSHKPLPSCLPVNSPLGSECGAFLLIFDIYTGKMNGRGPGRVTGGRFKWLLLSFVLCCVFLALWSNNGGQFSQILLGVLVYSRTCPPSPACSWLSNSEEPGSDPMRSINTFSV